MSVKLISELVLDISMTDCKARSKAIFMYRTHWERMSPIQTIDYIRSHGQVIMLKSCRSLAASVCMQLYHERPGLPACLCLPRMACEDHLFILHSCPTISSAEAGTRNITPLSMHVGADLNHVIHACTHPSWRDLPYYSEDEMMEQLERQVERIFDLVR